MEPGAADSRDTNKLRTVWIPFFTPVPKVLRRIESEFDRGARVVLVRGYPKAVYCFQRPEDNAAILRDRSVGETKLPALLPRVMHAMRSGAYILAGGSKWHDRRRQILPAFRNDRLKQYVTLVPELTRRTLNQVEDASARAAAIDVAEAMRLLVTALDLRMFFSLDVDADRLKQISDWIHFIEYHFVGVVPLWIPTPTNRRFLKCLDLLRKEFESIIRERATSNVDQQDLLSTLLGARDKENRRALTPDDVMDETFSVFFGASVMAVSLTWGLFLLAQNREIQAEFRRAVRVWLADNGNAPETLASSPDCDRVVVELLRLFPASWGYPRLCEAGMEVADVTVPPGAVVIPMIEYAHHNDAIWTDAHEFCPARHATAEGKSALSRHAHLPFGLGARTCLGSNLAPMILKIVLGMLVKDFEVKLSASGADSIKAEYGFEIQPVGPVPLEFRRLD